MPALPFLDQAIVHDTAMMSLDYDARCGTCQQWLTVNEAELLTSFEHPLVCWNCDTTQPA